jgi:GGDEF domain-containing protein
MESPRDIRPTIAPPDGWADLLTGTDGPRLWDRVVLSESARCRRYHRPVTVAMVDVVGLPDLAAEWGWDVAERALAASAPRHARENRTSNHVARNDTTRSTDIHN